MALKGTDLALVSARVGVARIGAFRLGFYPEDVEGVGTVGPGEYAWRETAPEDDGEEWELMTPWSMCGQRCVAHFTINATPSLPGVPVVFTDTTTPAAEITSWHWEFGDGASSDVQNPTHTYDRAGTFPVQMWASGPRGTCSATGTVTVTAQQVARLAVVGGPYWSEDATAGLSGFNGASNVPPFDTYFLNDSRRTLAAIVKWLTGKSSGAQILVLNPTAYPAAGATRYANYFQAGLAWAGHTVTVTGSYSSWAGFEPLNYDLVCMGNSLGAFAYHGLATAQEKVDYVLSNGGHILGECLANGGVWAPYGIDNAGGLHPTGVTPGGIEIHSALAGGTYGPGAGGGGWKYQRPFYCSQFGAAPVGGSWNTAYWALVIYSTNRVRQATNTMGGTVVYVDCACADGDNVGWSHFPPETYVLALWAK